jgi:hydrogenase-4 component B
MSITPADLVLSAVILFLLLGVSALILRQNQRLTTDFCFSLGATASLLGFIGGAWAVAEGRITQVILMLGLPDLPFHLRLDPLSGFFISVIGLLSFFVSVYSIGYVRGFTGKKSVTSLVLFYCLFISGMFMVVLADDALIFLIAWEIMALASYFLVLFEHERIENRRAAFIYMVIAHVGAVSILLSFGVMAGLATEFRDFSGYTFEAMRATQFPQGWATAAFLLAFFGFAAKAGIVPLHVWLPEAHPVAPSNISALMSGVMLKTAIYGIIRVTFDLIKVFPWWWGAVVLVLGLFTALFGILFALMQQDLKRLLAYSSVENIGVILIGIGLSMVFVSFGFPLLAALAITAGLYHSLNHALFKGLLFMGAGAVHHATHQKNMDRMGGLIHRMPWTAALFLIGCISASALPPFNGFVSEWLTFQAFLLSPTLPNPLLKLLVPMGAALLALTGALAAACFVKAFGVTFLGHWRGDHHPQIHEVNWPMRLGMIMAALSCLCLGILPTVILGWMDTLSLQLTGAEIGRSAGALGWMWLTPVAPERASYSGIIVFIGILAVVVFVYVLLHVKPGKIHRVPLWDCGFEKVTARMQYNATSFSMPIRRIFGYLFNIREAFTAGSGSAHMAFPKTLHHTLRIRDRFWVLLYKPIAAASFRIARKLGMLQQGRIQTYLIYSFLTIIILLVFVR